MDVKYIPADWDQAKSGIGDLIGLGRWGKGMIDDLKDVTKNMEDAKSDIDKFDSDGVVSFSHIDRESNFQEIFEKFDVMHKFTKNVGDIVDRTIDQPFYEDIDAFVSAMQQATISDYTTENRLGITEEKTVHYGQGVNYTTREAKAEVSLDDLLSGDNFYAEQMSIEYDMWKAENPDQDFSQEDYRMAAVNMNAFEYNSIEDQQLNKEFWVNVAAVVVIVGVAVVCPPAGLALGAAYGALELSSAVSGEDWLTGRELGTGERWLRGALAPLDIVPGVAGIKRLSNGVRLSNQAVDMGQMAAKPGLRSTIQREVTHVGDMINTARTMTVQRVNRAGSAVRDTARVAGDRIARDLQDVGRLADSAVTSAKNIVPTRNMVAAGDVGRVNMPAQNTHFFENKASQMFSRAEGVGTGGGGKPFVSNGQQFTNGRRNRLKPNIRYKTGEHNYLYETDHLGRISKFETNNLQLTSRSNRLSHSKNTPGKIKGQDHAGHLAGDRFGGSPVLDNLVSQSSEVNLKQYKTLENKWANAIKEGKQVKVNVDIIYDSNSLRPKKFDVQYEIDGELFINSFLN